MPSGVLITWPLTPRLPEPRILSVSAPSVFPSSLGWNWSIVCASEGQPVISGYQSGHWPVRQTPSSGRFPGCCPTTRLPFSAPSLPFSAPAFESDCGLPVPWSLIVQGEKLLKAFPRVRRAHPVPSKLWSFRTHLSSHEFVLLPCT